MKINTDINILGGLPDWNLINYFYDNKAQLTDNTINSFTPIKTEKSVKRFRRAILNTLLSFKNKHIEMLFRSIIEGEGLSNDNLLFLFWNASLNNDLFRYLNENIYFPAFYSGRFAIKNDDVVACLSELKNTNTELKKWSDSTVLTTASKYLTLLKKFGLLECTKAKALSHPFLSDKLFVIFVYWLIAISEKSNILNSPWLKYGFTEPHIFIDRIKRKQFINYLNIFYTGDQLKIEPKIEYENIYETITRN